MLEAMTDLLQHHIQGWTNFCSVNIEDAMMIKFFKLDEPCSWKVYIAKEVVETKANNMVFLGFSFEEQSSMPT